MATVAADVMTDVRERVDGLDWSALSATLDDVGHATTPVLLRPGDAARMDARGWLEIAVPSD